MPKPPAVFPAAIAGDSDLMIATNRLQTALGAPVGTSDTTLLLASTTGITANALLSIDAEIVLTTADPSGNLVAVQRGFDGTAPAVHLASAKVSGFVDAWHHNAAIAEIQAIEQTLGPNLSNVPGLSLITAPSYDFPAQTPGGSLTVGTNSITLTPVPRGVNGTDTHHYLYISGGTGTAESVPITGGTAVSGAASGTVFVTCANTHSGAWTIKSATAGAQEAHNDKVGPVIFPAGTFNWYGPFWSNGKATIQGAGPEATVLSSNSLTMKMFDIERDYFALKMLTLRQVGTPVTGNLAIFTAAAGSGGSTIPGAACHNAIIEDVDIWNFYNGILTDGGFGAVCLTRVVVNNSVADAITSQGTQGYYDSIVCTNNGGTAIKMSVASGGGGGAPPFMTGIQTFGSGGWGLYATVNVSISGKPSFFNNDKLGEIYVKIGGALGGWIKDASIQYAGSSPFFGTTPTAPGLWLDVTTAPFTLDNLQFFNTQGSAMVLNSGGHIIGNCVILGPGQGGSVGSQYAIWLTQSSDTQVNNCRISGLCLFNPAGSGNMLQGSSFGGVQSGALVEIASGADWIINGNYISNSGTGVSLQIDSPSSYQKGSNIVTGTMTNNGVISPRSKDLA